MNSINKVILTGRIGSSNLYSTSGGDVIAWSVALNESYKDKKGEWVEKTNWVKVIKWNPAESLKGFEKGTEILIEGKLQESEYTKEDGTKMKYLNVVALSVRKIGFPDLKNKGKKENDFADVPESDDMPF